MFFQAQPAMYQYKMLISYNFSAFEVRQRFALKEVAASDLFSELYY